MSTLSLVITPITVAEGPALDALVDLVDEAVDFHLKGAGLRFERTSYSVTLSVPPQSRKSGGSYIAVRIRGVEDFAPLGNLADVLADDLLGEHRHGYADIVLRVSATRMDHRDGTMQSTLYRRNPLSTHLGTPVVLEERGPIVETGITGVTL